MRAGAGDASDQPFGHGVRFRLQQALDHLDAGSPQAGDAGAVYPLIRIAGGDHDAANAGGDQRIGAGRGAAVEAARFQSDIGGGATGFAAGHRQGLRLSMRPAGGGGVAAPDHHAITHNHAADRGVRPGAAQAAPGQRQGGVHMRRV